MSTHVSSLPEAWVKRIFATMRGYYGAEFDRQWECPAHEKPEEHAATMLALWGRELRGFQQSPNAIAYALEHLPERPPNLVQFQAICRRAPQYAQPALPAPEADPAIVQQVIGAFRVSHKPPRAWVARLEARLRSGDKLTITQREMLQAAQQSSPFEEGVAA